MPQLPLLFTPREHEHATSAHLTHSAPIHSSPATSPSSATPSEAESACFDSPHQMYVFLACTLAQTRKIGARVVSAPCAGVRMRMERMKTHVRKHTVQNAVRRVLCCYGCLPSYQATCACATSSRYHPCLHAPMRASTHATCARACKNSVATGLQQR